MIRKDVTGDGIVDIVYLTGVETMNRNFIEDITLNIKDGKTGEVKMIPIKQNAGYNPRILLADFTGDGVDDIMIGIDSGGSGGIIFYYIYSFHNHQGQFLLDSDKYIEEYQYTVWYLDDFKVEVTSKKNHERYLIDLSCKGQEYLNQIYDINGKLKEPIEGWVDPLSGLYPIDFDANQVFSLLAYQGISGLYHVDRLGYVQNVLSFDGTGFQLENQMISIFSCP